MLSSRPPTNDMPAHVKWGCRSGSNLQGIPCAMRYARVRSGRAHSKSWNGRTSRCARSATSLCRRNGAASRDMRHPGGAERSVGDGQRSWEAPSAASIRACGSLLAEEMCRPSAMDGYTCVEIHAVVGKIFRCETPFDGRGHQPFQSFPRWHSDCFHPELLRKGVSMITSMAGAGSYLRPAQTSSTTVLTRADALPVPEADASTTRKSEAGHSGFGPEDSSTHQD